MVLLSSQHIFLRKWKKVSNPFCLEEAVVAGLSQTSQLSLIQSETQAITPSRVKLQSEKDCPNFHKLYKKKLYQKLMGSWGQPTCVLASIQAAMPLKLVLGAWQLACLLIHMWAVPRSPCKNCLISQIQISLH